MVTHQISHWTFWKIGILRHPWQYKKILITVIQWQCKILRCFQNWQKDLRLLHYLCRHYHIVFMKIWGPYMASDSHGSFELIEIIVVIQKSTWRGSCSLWEAIMVCTHPLRLFKALWKFGFQVGLSPVSLLFSLSWPSAALCLQGLFRNR
jgi:hypothetical protein